MNQFVDNTVLECDRQSSEEALVNNNENLAAWKNNLAEVIHLDAGDKVSLQGCMISELGAGQPDTVETKGVSLGFKKTFKITDEVGSGPDATLPTLFDKIAYNASEVTIDIKDNEMSFTTNYYINANGHNYISLPRRYIYNASDTDKSTGSQFGEPDNFNSGLGFFDPFVETKSPSPFFFFDDYYQIVPTKANNTAKKKFYKPKNDNTRYTIMGRDATYYTAASAQGNLPDRHVRDPENATYRTVTELKTITIEPGFNSPEFIASELTRQLQKITNQQIYEFRDPQDIIDNPKNPGFPLRIYDTISTETYKPFNVAFAYIDGGPLYEEYNIDFYKYIQNGAGTTNSDGYQWLSQYGLVATKRPELYETGRLCNIYSDGFDDNYTGIFGSTLREAWGVSDKIVLDLNYNASNCKLFKDFFDAQDLYPEIWNTFSDVRSGYNDGDTLDNSRWLHINRHINASMSFSGDAAANGNAMLGYSGYRLHSWNASELLQAASAILPIYYDPAQKDKFYECNSASNIFPDIDQLSYGCIRCSSDGKIILMGSNNNGYNSSFWTYLKGSNATLANRKIGFDMHFSAPGMAWLLPYAGYSQVANAYKTGLTPTDSVIGSGYYDTAKPGSAEYFLDGTLYKNKLYIGADSPKINWSGTNFAFSDLHTGMNGGQNNIAKNPYSASMTTIGTGEELDGSSTIVYKINPQEQYNDWTPTRKPYTFIETSTSGVKASGRGLNPNLEAWTVYDSLGGIFIKDFNLTELEWSGTFMDILGFTYRQFHNTKTNTRLERINGNNINDLSIITTNAIVAQTDSKLYVQNMWNSTLFNNMLPTAGTIFTEDTKQDPLVIHFPEIIKQTSSVQVIAENLPQRMLRGYYTIRSDILDQTGFVGGSDKVNTRLNVLGIVNKVTNTGDFYTQPESDLQFTVTEPIRIASVNVSIHDPDGSYARVSSQSTVLFKIQKNRSTTFNVLQALLDQNSQTGSAARVQK